MNLKKLFGLGIVIGGLSLFGNPITTHAMEYEQQWIKSWGGSGWDTFRDLYPLKDGGFLVTVYDGEQDYDSLIKYNNDFEEEWINDYDSYGLGISSVLELEDGSLLLVGNSMYSFEDSTVKGYSSAFIMKTDSNGVIEFGKNFDGSGFEKFTKGFQLSDGSFVAVGYSESEDAGFNNKGYNDIVVVKYSSEGEQQWVKNFGGSHLDCVNGVIQTKDGGWAIVGHSRSKDFGAQYGDMSTDAFLLKLDTDFNQQWVRCYTTQPQDHFNDLIETENGELIIVGQSTIVNQSTQNSMKATIVKYDVDGGLSWEYFVENEEFSNEFNDIIPNLKGGFLAAGNFGNLKVFELRKDQTVEPIIDLETDDAVFINVLLQTSNGDLLVAGETYATDLGFENQGEADAFLMKFSPKKDSDIQINGKVETMVADVTIPSISPDLVINPNLSEGFIAPEFSVSNDSVSPIKLELKMFEQVTDTFNDVLPTKYDSWMGLNKRQSQDIALGLIAKEGEGWQTLTTPMSYVAGHTEREIGVVKPASQVDFSFDVKHGTSFSEAKTVQYKMVFVFDLMN